MSSSHSSFSGHPPFVVGISSRALFDLDDSHKVYTEQGLEAYAQYQMAREDVPLKPGVAFDLCKKFLNINELLGEPLVEIILLSRNSGDTGLRIFNSIEHHNLGVIRAAFTNGAPPDNYIEAFNADLFLSANAEDVQRTLAAGYAAATILPGNSSNRVGGHSGQLRIAFDGDAVIFSDESELIYQKKGLQAFADNERTKASNPMSGGPFKSVLEAIQRIQSSFPFEDNPIRTALVTARSAPAHKRVILTLRQWGIRIDEALFLGGNDKGPFLKSFKADIFFDDQHVHCDSARNESVNAAHVPGPVDNS